MKRFLEAIRQPRGHERGSRCEQQATNAIDQHPASGGRQRRKGDGGIDPRRPQPCHGRPACGCAACGLRFAEKHLDAPLHGALGWILLLR